LFRALRVDKLTIAALEATLQSYLRGALDEIPALRMIRIAQQEIAARAQNFREKLRRELANDVKVEIHPGFSVIGGGSTPDQQLPTTLIAISTPRHSAAQLEERLRKPQALSGQAGISSPSTPVISRIEDKRLIIDLRTVHPSEETEVASALIAALA
jgi:L-seryl-tRNA(Ser) seleniumtransferase